MLLLEVTRLGGQRFVKDLVGTVVASAVSFGIYFAIAGSVFLDAYKVPQYAFHDWQLPAAIPLGLFATVLVVHLGAAVQVMTRTFAHMKVPTTIKPLIGGAVFGLVGVILPLTMFTGSTQLKTVLHDAGAFGAAFLGVVVLAKMMTFAVSGASGFVGGPIFPALFIGGTAGVFFHALIPGVPLGLAFTCLLAAVPGSLVAAPGP